MARALKSARASRAKPDAPRIAGPAPEPAALAAIPALVAAAAAAWTFSGAAALGFSQDDFLGLARATGLAERLSGPWRWLSHQGFWDVLVGPGGRSATVGHVLVLAAHAATVALLAWLLSRRLSAAAALIGAAFVATHPSLFTALHWLAANGDVFATLFGLSAVAVFGARGPVRWTAAPLFAVALAFKESVLPLPAALLVLRASWPDRAREEAAPRRDPVLAALALVAAAWIVAWLGGARGPALGGAAYATSAGAIGPNLLTYDGWLANRWFATTRGFTDAVDPAVYPWAVGLNVAWLAGAFVPALRRRGWLAAGLAWAVMLLPVLPLHAHTNHYYVAAALPAAGLLVAVLADVLLSRGPRPVALAAAVLIAAGFAADGRALVRRIAEMPFLISELRADPTVDRARIAANVAAGLRGAALARGTTLHVWSPQSRALAVERGGDPAAESYFERNLRAALLDGLAIRVMAPAVDSVRFEATFDTLTARGTWAVVAPDGRLRVAAADSLRSVVRAATSR